MRKILDTMICSLARIWEIRNSIDMQDLKRVEVRVDLIIGLGAGLKIDGSASIMTEKIAKMCAEIYYGLGKQSGFILSGGYSCNGITEAEAMKKIILAERISPCLIQKEEISLHTWMSAEAILKIMIKRRFRSAIIVSQHIHSRRVRATFRKFFAGSGIRLYFVKARSGYEKIPQRRWTSEARFLLAWEIPVYFYSKLKGWA